MSSALGSSRIQNFSDIDTLALGQNLRVEKTTQKI